jgi:hypothetical protein
MEHGSRTVGKPLYEVDVRRAIDADDDFHQVSAGEGRSSLEGLEQTACLAVDPHRQRQS